MAVIRESLAKPPAIRARARIQYGSAAGAIAVVTLATLVLAAGQLIVPSLSSFESLRPLPGGSGLDYARATTGSIPPLAPEFVASVFGEDSSVVGDARRTSDGIGHVEVAGRQEVDIQPLANDRFDDAYRVGSIPFTGRTDASGANRDPGEASATCAPAGGTIWFRYRPAVDEGLIANTFGATRPTAIAVFEGDATEPAELRCDSDLEGNAQVAFPAVSDTTYYFQITAATGGDVVFNLDPLGSTERVSVDAAGGQADDYARSWLNAMTSDGRFVVFSSAARNLVDENGDGVFDDDTNDHWDVFLHDRHTRQTERISRASDGREGNDNSGLAGASISADGRYVAFGSWASNLADEDGDGHYDDDENGSLDVFVRDRVLGTTIRVSLSSDGRQGRSPVDPIGVGHVCYGIVQAQCAPTPRISMSADGRFIAFDSDLVGLVPEEPGPHSMGRQVFVHDRRTARTSMVSVDADGAAADGTSELPSMSADGRLVAFRSAGTNLDPLDTDPSDDIFVHDRRTRATRLVSVARSGDRGGNAESMMPSMSADGRHVAFSSWASDLVYGDSNEIADIFVRDLTAGVTDLVSVSSTGGQQEFPASDPRTRIWLDELAPSISWDGRYVAFRSPATNLVPGDDEPSASVAYGNDVFVHDRVTATTIKASISSAGREGEVAGGHIEADAYEPIISADGRIVAFSSADPGLVEADTNASPNGSLWWLSGEGWDVFVHEFPVLR